MTKQSDSSRLGQYIYSLLKKLIKVVPEFKTKRPDYASLHKVWLIHKVILWTCFDWPKVT